MGYGLCRSPFFVWGGKFGHLYSLKMKMKKTIIIFSIICLLNLSCTLKKNSVVINSSQDSATPVNCSYPFTPSNNLVLMLFYKDAMRYLTHSDDIC